MLDTVVGAAIAHWADAGVTAEPLASLNGTDITIADLSNSGLLANTSDAGITIDINGAGWGWFVDSTPSQNEEFDHVNSPTELAASSGEASGQIDLLTVVEHELGH